MIVTIPSIGGSTFLAPLLDVLTVEPGVTQVMIVDNFPGDGPGPAFDRLAVEATELNTWAQTGKVRFVRRPGQSIYAAWNMGIDHSTELGVPVACLNDDIILRPGALAAAAFQFRTGDYGLIGLNYFDPHVPVDRMANVRIVSGTYRHHGFGGFAFILPPGSPRVDERFRWWYGDDDLAERVKLTGRPMGIAEGAPVDHPFPSTTGHQHPWTAEATAGDAALWSELWPHAI